MKKTPVFFLIGLMIVVALLFSGSGNFLEERDDMKSIIDVLKNNKIEHYVFSNDQGHSYLVVPKFGARILAVSIGGENLFWTHPDILKGRGGQRTWISPEGGPKGFIFRKDWKGNRDFSMMDPGDYEIILFEENEHLILKNSFKIRSNDGNENYSLSVTREMGFAEDPLGNDSGAKDLDYEYLGIDFVHKLKNNSQSFLDRVLALWCLIQIPPKGTMIVPVQQVGEQAWRGNYFEPIPKEFVYANPGSFSYFIHGSQRYKVGVTPQSAKGAIGYISKTRDGNHFLVLMTFPVKPEGHYVDKPKSEQNTNGDAIQIYSHLEKGNLAFGELECHSWGLELQSGDEKAFSIRIYMYKSALETLKRIGKKIVCPEFNKAYIFE